MDKIIYLTFDDGPEEPYLSDALGILEKFNAKATFFVCGMSIEKNPEMTRRIVAAGHALGNHTYSHDWKKVLSGALQEEIKVTSRMIAAQVGAPPKFFRAPWGITRKNIREALTEKGYVICHWNVMAFDWWQPSVEFISRHVINRAYPGAVVLLHLGNGVKPGNRKNTVAALMLILAGLQTRGYSFKALDAEYLKANHQEVGKWTDIFKDIGLAIVGK